MSNDLISRSALLAEYDRVHVGAPGGARKLIGEAPDVDAEPVRHGEWALKAHDERTNYRWNVTAMCSECCDEEKEIWAGFFPGFPDWLARDIALREARKVKLSNYCPNCGAKMDGGAVNV